MKNSQRFKIIIITLLPLFFACIGYAKTADTTFNAMKYYSMGVPTSINSVTALDWVQIVFFELSQQNKDIEVLPKYHSSKSGIVFKSVFSEDTVDRIIDHSPNPYIALHAHLAIGQKYDLMFHPYILQNQLGNYEFELACIRMSILYNMMRSLELIQANFDVFPDDYRRLNNIYKILKSQLEASFGQLVLENSKGFRENDVIYLTERLRSYLKRISEIKFIKNDQNIINLLNQYRKVKFPIIKVKP